MALGWLAPDAAGAAGGGDECGPGVGRMGGMRAEDGRTGPKVGERVLRGGGEEFEGRRC